MAELNTFGRRTLYRAVTRPDGRIVCIDTNFLAHTCKVFDNARDYELAQAQGWTNDPQEAMRRAEAEADAVSTDAAVRAYDDRRLTPAAQAEAAAVESTTVKHLPEIPEVSQRTEPQRQRGRPRKVPTPV